MQAKIVFLQLTAKHATSIIANKKIIQLYNI